MSLVRDLPFFNGTVDELADILAEPHPQTRTVFTVNLDFLALGARCEEFRAALRAADILAPDGAPVLWLRWLYGRPLKARVTGSDLVPALARRLATRKASAFILGAMPSSRMRAEEVLRSEFPGLRITGLSPTREMLQSAVTDIHRAIVTSEPSALFVALGAPRQELWIHRNRAALPPMVMVGVGAAVDFLSGQQRRAPLWLQERGLEWLWRMASKPGRLAGRYLLRDAPFLCTEVVRALWRGRVDRASA